MKSLLGEAILIAFLVLGAAFAQSDRGTITGSVMDPLAAMVPGAKVVARNVDTGVMSETATTETGNFTLPSMPAGKYEVSVEAAGFKKVVQQNVQVQVAQTIRVDLTVQVGSAAESITVTDSAPLLRTENAEQSMNVTGDRINNLPINFGGGGGSTGSIRNWLSFIQLAPGVSGTNERAAINGAPGGAFKIYLEGQDITSSNDTVWTSTVASASVEAIGEFALQSGNFSAEFGQVMGGVFNFTTKSGGNQFHGSGYEYFANEALDAYRPFLHNRPISRKHDWGLAVGGPVYLSKLYDGRNKTFFFFNFEDFRNKTRSGGTFDTVPTEAYRRGDFSAALTGRTLENDVLGRPIVENGIYDPLTTRTQNGSVVRDPFSNNVIPVARLDAVAGNVQKLIPSPINTQLTQNWLPDTSNHRFQSLPSVKIDHSISDFTKLSGYWSVQKTDQITGPDGLPFPLTHGRYQKIYGHTIRLNLDKTITPTLLLHVGAGYLRFHNPDSSPPEVLDYDAVGGIGFKGSATGKGFPYISAMNTNQGGFAQQTGPNTAGLYYNDKMTGVANATYIRNNHTFKLGAEWKQEVWTDQNFYQSTGFLNFGRNQTALPYKGTTSIGSGSYGFPYASFFLGAVNSATVTAPRTLQWRKQAWSLYVQDTWRVNRKLTFDYGLRWDLAGQGNELHNRTSQIGVNTPNPSAGGLPGATVYAGYGAGRCNCDFVKTYPYAVGPRLGLAYQLNDKTVLRAGWGITYSAGANWWYVTGGSSSLGVGFNSLTWDAPGFGESSLQLKDGLNYDLSSLFVASLDPGIVPVKGQLNVAPAWGAQINDPNGGRPARINQWNIAVQRELLKDISLEVAYVGSRGVWLEANNLVSMNALNPATLAARGLDIRNAADRTLLTSRIDSPLAAQRGFAAPYAGYPGSVTVAQTLRPFPQFNDGLALRWAPLGNTWYDSLQTKFTKRYSRGLDMTASFTWQKELALGAGGNPGAGGGGMNDVFNRKNQKSLTGASQPLIFVVGFNYETPKFGSKITRLALGDWTFGGILRYASGSLLGVPGSQNNLSQLIYQSTRQNRVAGEPLFLQNPSSDIDPMTKNLILNPKAWADAAPGEWGTAAPYYNDFRWKRSVNESLSLGRTVPIREKMSFQIRAEYFNVFNRLNIGSPSTGNPLGTPTFDSQGRPTGGFGYVNAINTGGQRNGQLVARFRW